MAVFGKSPIDPSILAGEIISALRCEKRDGRRKWNKTVRRLLCGLADPKLYLVHPDAREGCGEWLLDVIWFTRKQGTILLAVEVELGTKKNEVLYDFQKLLCIKAPLKVMVYYAYRGSYMNEFENYVKDFDHHVRGEQYLLVEMAPGPSDQAYLYDVRKDGQQSRVRFSHLGLTGSCR